MTKVKLVSKPEEYFDMLTSDEIEVTDASFVSDDVIELRYENKENFVEPNARTNAVIAAFTTAHARLKFYMVYWIGAVGEESVILRHGLSHIREQARRA